MGITIARIYREGVWLDVIVSSEQLHEPHFDLSQFVEQDIQRQLETRKRKSFKTLDSQPLHQKLIALLCRKRKSHES